jgi:hypothetical protein
VQVTYAQGFSWGRERTGLAVIAVIAALTALIAAPPPPGADTTRATGRLVRVVVRQLSHASNGPAGAIKRVSGEVGRPLVIIGGFAARVPAGSSVTHGSPLPMAGFHNI